jgi:ribosomal protein S27AE
VSGSQHFAYRRTNLAAGKEEMNAQKKLKKLKEVCPNGCDPAGWLYVEQVTQLYKLDIDENGVVIVAFRHHEVDDSGDDAPDRFQCYKCEYTIPASRVVFLAS